MKAIQSALLALAAATTCLPAAADTAPNFDAIAKLVNTAKDAAHLPSGTAVAIVKDGKIIYQGYFGYADIQAQQKVDKNTEFYIASSTKPFFALNALLEARAGKLDTDASLQSLFPDLDFPAIDAKRVTVRNLLTHTHGIDNLPLVWATAFSGIHSPSSLRGLVADSKPNTNAPLGTFQYTNVGYNILSVALGDRLKRPWQDELAHNIFQPLGMTHTSAYMSDADKHGWTVAKPYSLMSRNPTQPLYLQKTDATMQAAGGMITTADDMARFLIAEMNHGKLDGKQVISADVIRRSQKKQATTDAHYLDFKRDGYAWGWYTGTYKGKRMLHHFGGFAGYHAHLSYIPDIHAGLVVLNSEDFLSARLTSLIADLAYGTLLQEPDIKKKVDKRLAGLVKHLQGMDRMVAKHYEKIDARPWRLSQPTAAYVGEYKNELLGTIQVTSSGKSHLHLEWGNLHADATGYDKPDVIRVALVPNSGNLVSFQVQKNAAQSLTLDGMVFTKR